MLPVTLQPGGADARNFAVSGLFGAEGAQVGKGSSDFRQRRQNSRTDDGLADLGFPGQILAAPAFNAMHPDVDLGSGVPRPPAAMSDTEKNWAHGASGGRAPTTPSLKQPRRGSP